MALYGKLLGAGGAKDGATPPSRFSRAPRYARVLARKDRLTGFRRPVVTTVPAVQTERNSSPILRLKKPIATPKKILSRDDGGFLGGVSRALAGARSLLSPAQQTAAVPTQFPTLPDGTAYTVEPSTGGGIFGRLFGEGNVPSSFAGSGVEVAPESAGDGFPGWIMLAAVAVIGWLLWRGTR